MLCVFLCPTHPTEQNTLSALLCHKWPDCLLRVAESQSGMCTRCPFIVPCLWQALRMLPCLVTRAELSHFCYDPCDTDKNTEAWGQHLLRVTRLGRAGAGVQTLPPCAAFTGSTLGMAACLPRPTGAMGSQEGHGRRQACRRALPAHERGHLPTSVLALWHGFLNQCGRVACRSQPMMSSLPNCGMRLS